MVRVIIPVKVQEEGDFDLGKAEIDRHFGKVPFYACFDSVTGEYELVRNTNHHFGGTDTPADVVEKAGAKFVIASHLGGKPYSMFQERGIEVLDAGSAKVVDEVVRLWLEGKLSPMASPDHDGCCGH
ncbi:MAG: hypothetical protein D6732_21035 [Methanobacteriota archaeon]|nr:MAG: hypothetical protein D6732_21035 [Euryarchaeota archaeon]